MLLEFSSLSHLLILLFSSLSRVQPGAAASLRRSILVLQHLCTAASARPVLSFPPNVTESVLLPAEGKDRPELVMVECYTV